MSKKKIKSRFGGRLLAAAKEARVIPAAKPILTPTASMSRPMWVSAKSTASSG